MLGMSEQLEVLDDGRRRQRVERRQPNLRSMFYALFKSRRKTTRRSNEAVCYYCDDYGPHVFATALLLMVLCVLDSYFTLLLLQYGSTELNPILAWALNKHVMFFFILKYSLTSVCVVVAVMHKNFRVFGINGFQLLLACIVGYAILIDYQLHMLLPILS
jgi:hypothetical protein